MQLILAIIMLIASVIPTLYIAEAREQYREHAPVQISKSVQYEQVETSAEARPVGKSKDSKLQSVSLTQIPKEALPSVTDTNIPPLSTSPKNTRVATPAVKKEVTISAPTPAEPVVEEDISQEKKSVPQNYTEFTQELRAEIHRLTNKERKQEGLSALTYSLSLTAIADEHSTDMAEQSYFEHTSPSGCTLTCRFTQAEYKASTWGENIAWISGDPLPSAQDLAASFFESWMKSDGHRENILSDKFTHEGIGVARTGNTVYATANFAKPL